MAPRMTSARRPTAVKASRGTGLLQGALVIARRAAHAARVLRRDGVSQFLAKLTARAVRQFGLTSATVPVAPEDIVDAATLTDHPSPVAVSERNIEVGWICTPPSAGSGGHTTLLRFVDALESRGHRCVLYVYDRHGGDVRTHERELRSWWPHIRSEVRDARAAIAAHDAYVATSWSTAHVLAAHSDLAGHRFYLAQDFEPYFYPRGSEYALAEETYRFGFHCITVGHMVANVLRDKFQIDAAVAEFGCDTAVYGLDRQEQPRSGIVFYTKPDTPRRGYALGVLALEQFHKVCPDIPIHTFGALAGDLPFPATRRRHIAPGALAALYNTVSAGLALSFTNVSLITYELLACGAVPVVNDSPYTRADLANDYVGWARPTPSDLARALKEAVDRQAEPGYARAVANSVSEMSWNPARETFVKTLEQHVLGRPNG